MTIKESLHGASPIVKWFLDETVAQCTFLHLLRY